MYTSCANNRCLQNYPSMHYLVEVGSSSEIVTPSVSHSGAQIITYNFAGVSLIIISLGFSRWNFLKLKKKYFIKSKKYLST